MLDLATQGESVMSRNVFTGDAGPPFYRWIGLLLLISTLMWGCASMSPVSETPSGNFESVNISDISLRSVRLDFKLRLNNPYWTEVGLRRMDYLLTRGDTVFVSGTRELSGSIPASGSRVVTIPTRVAYTTLFSSLIGIRPGIVIPYRGVFTLYYEAPMVGKQSLNVEKTGGIPIPAPPSLEGMKFQWDQTSWARMTGRVNLTLHNPNTFGVSVEDLFYRFSLNESSIMSSRADRNVTFQPGEQNTLSVPISFSPSGLGTGLFQTLTGGRARMVMEGRMTLSTPYGRITVPFQRTADLNFQFDFSTEDTSPPTSP